MYAPTPLQDERFLLLTPLGRGGMASVFRAFDRVEQELVVLKTQLDVAAAGPAHPLAAEFDVWSRLDHPNVVRAYELCVARRGPLAAGTPYLVLEHVDGLPVDRTLRPGGVPPDLLEHLAVELLRGLDHVHSTGMLHRDLKPANILVDRAHGGSGVRVKLTDFGLATPEGAAEEPGRISGSLPYIAPEVLLGRALDARADLYSLGIVLFQLAAGAAPAGTGDLESVIAWHLAGPPLDPRRRIPGFSPRLARFIRRLGARDRRRRPADAGEALALLGAVGPRPPAVGRGGAPGAAGQPHDRAERAELRLALDAVRLGARRRLSLAAPGRAAPLVHQARVWSQIHGLAFHDLRRGLLRPVLDCLLDRADEAPALVRAHRLDRWLPVTTLSGVPLVDPAAGSVPRSAAARAAVHLARFFLDCSETRGLVLVAPGPAAEPLVRRTVARLRGALEPPRPAGRRRGGLLLLD